MARLSTLLLAVLAALAVAPVQAASFSSASLSDFRITLADLNPADGITPAITFPNYRGDFAGVFARIDGDTRGENVSGTPGPFHLSVATARSSALAAVNGAGPTTVTSLTASGAALGPTVLGGDSAYNAVAESPNGTDFVITANTRVLFSAFARAQATTTFGSERGIGDVAFAFGDLHLEVVGHGVDEFQSLFIGASLCGELVCPAETNSGARFLTVSFANLTDASAVGFLDRRAAAQGFSTVVPEPETYAMMVAGLGLLGFMLRRRGKRPRG